ncbi:ABC transporter ATP-binding protein [Chryseolinea lacunae]|uniref:ABC transporter ATP-binding protein n=1 Tax=Chryseolinea lacunae TaxID=2801331 RepID=A0ABS1KV00_9BACT|nr:ABC transporter ATP-binding protein [Chryseolinea lacunae]MBL0743294.1 ABC transporter ATP-binding protein [Chryseolinea lacunae]
MKQTITPLLSLQALTVGYVTSVGSNILFENLDLGLNAGELTCFMGPNGIGKSTLIRTLAGLQTPLAGTVRHAGALLPSGQKSNGPLPQLTSVVLTDKVTSVQMNVRELVSFGRYPYLGWNITLSRDDKDKVEAALAEVHIQHLASHRLFELSDGQLQMVMIARALAQETPVILLDEPTAHLDLNNRVEVMNLLRRLARKLDKAILIATHELDLALQTADLIWLAGREKTLITGMPEDLVLSGVFDEVFQFKGYNLKTGRVQHEAYRGKAVSVSGHGHALLWTKNALERNGFEVISAPSGLYIEVVGVDDATTWVLQDGNTFHSLRALLAHLP